MTTNRPVKHIRFRGVEATIWPNTGPTGPKFTITLQRVYQDANRNWKGTPSMSLFDIPIAIKVLDLAADWVLAHSKEPANSGPPVEHAESGE